MNSMELMIEEFEIALLQINRMKASEIFERLSKSENSFGLLAEVTRATLERIGEGWETGVISLSQVYMSGIICEELIDKYMPVMNEKRKDIPKIAIGVLQDHHALGKRLVYSVLRANGFEITDFGQGLGVDELVQKTIDQKIEILIISTLMLPSALKVLEVKQKLAALGVPTRIIAGGAPFRLDSNLWATVHADADGKSASDVISIIETLVNKEGK